MLVFATTLITRSLFSRTSDLFEIIVPLTALFALHYPIRGAFSVLWPDLIRFPLNWPTDSEFFIFRALLLSFFGLLFFYVGYFWKSKDRLHRIIPRISFADGTYHWYGIKIITIYMSGFFAFMMLFRSGSGLRFLWDEVQQRTATIQLWLLLDDFRRYGLLLAWLSWRRGAVYRFLALSLLFINISIGVGMGSKNEIFLAILAVLIALYYMGNLTKARVVQVSILCISLFLLVFFPLVQSYRQLYLTVVGRQIAPTIDDITDVAGESLSFLTSGSGAFPVRDAVVEVVNRASWIDSAVMMLRWVPDYISYQNGGTLYPLLIGWIPRAIWPNKPALNLGSYMHNVIIGSSTQSNVGLTLIGEFYLNFNVWGVLVGMFVMGIFVRIIYLYVRNCSAVTTYQVLLYYALYPSLLFSLQSNLGAAVVGIVRTTLVVLAIIAFLSTGGTRLQKRSVLHKSK